MIKTLTRHGNSAALIIDKAILEILNIDMDTPLKIVTDGTNLIISPVRDQGEERLVTEAYQRVKARHRETFRMLAESDG